MRAALASFAALLVAGCGSFSSAPTDAGAPSDGAASDAGVEGAGDGSAAPDAASCPSQTPFSDEFERSTVDLGQGWAKANLTGASATLIAETQNPLSGSTHMRVSLLALATGTRSAYLERALDEGACSVTVSFQLRLGSAPTANDAVSVLSIILKNGGQIEVSIRGGELFIGEGLGGPTKVTTLTVGTPVRVGATLNLPKRSVTYAAGPVDSGDTATGVVALSRSSYGALGRLRFGTEGGPGTAFDYALDALDVR